ncbi:hypothetical protein ACIQUV_17545 [Streptomyces globosus]|uniref:hypothetical protein n=1 Tax=Streptomyces globosus TaxID=68209 RepID=UPI00382CA78F
MRISPYSRLTTAYRGLLGAIRERGPTRRGPVREAYLTGPARSAPEAPTTRPVVPEHEEDAA